MQLTHSCWDEGIWIVPLSLNNRLANAGTPVILLQAEKRITTRFPPAYVRWSRGSGNATQLRSNLIWQLQAVFPTPSVFHPKPRRSVWKPHWIYHNYNMCCCWFLFFFSHRFFQLQGRSGIRRSQSFYLMSKECVCNKGTKAAERRRGVSQDAG